MSKIQNTITVPRRQTALERIQLYLCGELTDALNSAEERLFSRLLVCNALLNERKYSTEGIINKIKDQFGVSVHTARKDLDYTYKLFARVTEAYKQYHFRLHVEYIDKKIREWENDKSLAHLIPKLLAERTRALSKMPVEIEQVNLPAPVIVISTIGKGDPMDVNALIEQADALISFEKDHEYIEFEDLSQNDAKQRDE